MTHLHADPALPIVEAPATRDPIGTLEGPLVLTGRAGSRAFLVEAGSVGLTGPEGGAIATVTIGGHVRAAGIEVEADPAVNVVASPGVLRRERVGVHGSVLETLLAAPTLPLAAVQWAAPAGAPAPRAREIAFTLVPGAASARYRLGPGTVTAVDDARPNEIVVATLLPPPPDWSVAESPSGGAAVHARPIADGPITLVLSAGPEPRVRSALHAASHLATQERRAHGRPKPGGLLTVSSGVAEIDDAVAWACARLAASLAHPEPAAARRAPVFWSAMGALAAGDADTALRALSLLERYDDDAHGRAQAGSATGGPSLPAGPLAPLVAARVALTLGDAGPALRHVRALEARRVDEIRAASDEASWAFWSLTLQLLADGLRHGASEDDIRRLRDAAALPASTSMRHERLPVLGSPGRSGTQDAAGLLRLLLRLTRGSGFFSGSAGAGAEPADLLGAWGALAAGEIDRGWLVWRSALSAGLRGALGPRGTWDGPEGPQLLGAPGAAALVGGLVHGLLGLAPDAPSGRVELSPALPPHLLTFEVSNLIVGECRFTLSYRRAGSTLRYALEPTEGRIPPNLVLTPTVPCRAIGEVRVDGSRADLEVWPVGPSGARIQVQLPLDGARSLEVETR